MAKQEKKRHNFWHPATYDTLRTAGELGGGRWEASSSSSPLSACLRAAGRAQSATSAGSMRIPFPPLSHVHCFSLFSPVMGHWPGVLNQATSGTTHKWHACRPITLHRHSWTPSHVVRCTHTKWGKRGNPQLPKLCSRL